MNRPSPWLIIFFVFLTLSFISGSRVSGLVLILLVIYFLQKYGYLNKLKIIKDKIMSDTINIKTMPSTVNTKDSSSPRFSGTKKFVWGAVSAIIIIFLLSSSIVVVDAGKTGVYSLFGKVRDKELSSGFHLINPLAKVIPMTIRTEEYTMSIMTGEGKKTGADAIAALTKEGLNVDLDITVLYHLNEPDASDVYKNVGLNYEEKIIRPAIRSSIREVVAKYEAKDIYSEKRSEATIKIEEILRNKLEPRGIVLEEVLLRNVKLPADLAKSIQEKLQAEQEAQKYDFLLEKEKKEAERKVIEAKGQRDAQEIINQSLSTNYLYYLYINQLKDRPGTIYVPTSPSTGLPLFRNLGN